MFKTNFGMLPKPRLRPKVFSSYCECIPDFRVCSGLLIMHSLYIFRFYFAMTFHVKQPNHPPPERVTTDRRYLIIIHWDFKFSFLISWTRRTQYILASPKISIISRLDCVDFVKLLQWKLGMLSKYIPSSHRSTWLADDCLWKKYSLMQIHKMSDYT